jgi:hypothetical protein
MSVFKKLLSKEARERIKEADVYYANRCAEIKSLSNKNLAITVKHYLAQMEAPRKYAPDAPVYDSVFYYIIIPEILERLND